jgi:hypothetical protein
VRDDVDAITDVAYPLLVVGVLLNLATTFRSPVSDRALPWRAKWMAQARRHPLLRGAALVCLLAAVALFIADIVVNYT